jgi:hypothetical protein
MKVFDESKYTEEQLRNREKYGLAVDDLIKILYSVLIEHDPVNSVAIMALAITLKNAIDMDDDADKHRKLAVSILQLE